MASIFAGRANEHDLARRMSSHLAAALVIFALLQIFVVAKLGGSLLMHFGIVLAVGFYAAAARAMESRWKRLALSGLPDVGLTTRFRIDLLQVWGAVLLAPFLWISVSVVSRFLFG